MLAAGLVALALIAQAEAAPRIQPLAAASDPRLRPRAAAARPRVPPPPAPRRNPRPPDAPGAGAAPALRRQGKHRAGPRPHLFVGGGLRRPAASRATTSSTASRPGSRRRSSAAAAAASRYGLLLASLRLVPLRLSSIAFALTGRGGRVLLGDHADGWGAGRRRRRDVPVLAHRRVRARLRVAAAPSRQLLRRSHGCYIHGPIIGVRFGF